MKPYFLLALLLVTIVYNIRCSESNKSANKSTQEVEIDTSLIAIIQFDQIGVWPFPQDYTPSKLTIEDVALLDSIILAHIKTYNGTLGESLKEPYGVNFSEYRYKRQYIPIINHKGEKEVWANFFCDTWNKDWKKEIIFVHDGGNCYFNLKVNLATMQCYEFQVNGYACLNASPNNGLAIVGQTLVIDHLYMIGLLF